MKKRLLLYISIAAAVGCTEQDNLTPDVYPSPEENILTIDVSTTTQSNTDSRVALGDSDDGGLSVTWADESETLGAWSSPSASFTLFSMVEGSLSNDKESASFTGVSPSNSMRLIHPYDADATISAEGAYTVDMSTQSIDIESDNGLGSMGGNTYMISEIFEPSSTVSPTMRHLGGALKIGLRFDGISTSKQYKITKLYFGANDGIDIPTKATIDMSKDVDNDDFTISTESGYLTIDVSGSPAVSSYNTSGETYYVNINTLPFTIEPQDTMMLGVELTAEDNSTTSSVFSITYSGTSDYDIPRASYTSLNYTYFIMSVVANATIEDWEESVEMGDVDLSVNSYTISEINANNIPIGDTWTITDETIEVYSRLEDNGYAELCAALAAANDEGRKISIVFPNLTVIDQYAFYSVENLISVEAPNVKSINPMAFFKCYALTSVNMPEVEEVEGSAFFSCSALANVNMPKVEKVGGSAFEECGLLKSIDMPNIDSIEQYAFCKSGLESIELPNITNIAENVFLSCSNLKTIKFDNVEVIEQSAFGSSAVENIYIPKVRTIGYSAFSDTKLESIDLPELTTLGEGAFGNCSALKNISMPKVETIDDLAFHSCSGLVSIELPSVISIGETVFGSCKALESITLPKVTSIGSSSFSFCTALKSIYLTTDSEITCGEYLFRTSSWTNETGSSIVDLSEATLYINSINSNLDIITGADYADDENSNYNWKEIIYVDKIE